MVAGWAPSLGPGCFLPVPHGAAAAPDSHRHRGPSKEQHSWCYMGERAARLSRPHGERATVLGQRGPCLPAAVLGGLSAEAPDAVSPGTASLALLPGWADPQSRTLAWPQLMGPFEAS